MKHVNAKELLPAKAGQKIHFEAHGRKFVIGKHGAHTYWLATDPPGDHRRWGNQGQILQDLRHVEEFGALPKPFTRGFSRGRAGHCGCNKAVGHASGRFVVWDENNAREVGASSTLEGAKKVASRYAGSLRWRKPAFTREVTPSGQTMYVSGDGGLFIHPVSRGHAYGDLPPESLVKYKDAVERAKNKAAYKRVLAGRGTPEDIRRAARHRAYERFQDRILERASRAT